MVQVKAGPNGGRWVSAALTAQLGSGSALATGLVELLSSIPDAGGEAADVDMEAVGEKKGANKRAATLPEVEMFVALLALLALIDLGPPEHAVTASTALLARLGAWNRRSLDLVAERVYFYASWAHERVGKLDTLRSTLLGAQRTACLHHNTPCQATLLNLLLRNYQHYKLFDQARTSSPSPRPRSRSPRAREPAISHRNPRALPSQADKLLAKSVFPESASNCQFARFFFYTGRIKANLPARDRDLIARDRDLIARDRDLIARDRDDLPNGTCARGVSNRLTSQALQLEIAISPHEIAISLLG